MKIPRGLSGEDLVKVLCRSWGCYIIDQDGSHIVLETAEPPVNASWSPRPPPTSC
ncbi:MAG TPA: hypothetical protein VFZ27_08880 [Terriglobia bacterium]|nr:hypothetical protein [Terriglobia bacterium]